MSAPGTGETLRAALAACRRHALAAAGFSALVNILYIAPTLYMLQVYDRVVPTRGLNTLLFLTLVLLFALGTLSLLDRVRARLLVRAGVGLDLALAPQVLDATIGQSDLPAARQALRSLDTLRGALSGAAILALFDAPWTPVYILACAAVSPWIALVALLGCLLLPAIAWANERATRARLDRAQVVASASYAHQDAVLASAEAVRALGMRRALVARQLRQRQAMLAAQTEANFATGGYLTATKFVRLALQSLALGLGALLAAENQISAGAIFASSFLIARALAPIELLIGHSKAIAQARQAYADLRALLDVQPLPHDPTHLPAPRGALAVEAVTIFNETRSGAVVQGVSLEVAPGEVLAIVGSSGAGKSTLARMIAGAIAPDRGAIRIDGADMRDWDAERLARHIGYLPQDTALVAGTIAENIARFSFELGGERAGIDAAIVAAAERTGAHDLILSLADGYGHRLGLGGRGLSAGQAQRIALARALFGDPALLVLDEPNAHLDSEGDAALAATLAALKAAGKTIIVVSHKTSILSVVDRMLVMRGGRPELIGPRDEVLKRLAPPAPAPAKRGNVVSLS